MMYTLINNEDGTTTIQVSFLDEGVELEGETSIKGDDSKALAYIPTYEQDLRRNYADLFPVPEITGGDGNEIR